MKAWHPDPYSKQAREKAKSAFYCYKNCPELSEEKIIYDFFTNSYRAKIVRIRAAKRFGKLVRADRG